ncbi:Glycosyl transferase family 39 [Croceitalea dokdonensis DOKDO 023]|uniref:Glycosyl transferase family 39 n=1 Tax=Croceitalea dokdonensis DOKDO 023 TaxID=1300341 RepID=A0A0P7AV21_9FLAO|nr:glycosyltransferase family 39 protein [Croceitalea dokdonensis]KPM31745.1 Glycosyl transferase family 39 [Croceitalea dokdonensis DOKDO 023]
MISTARYWFLIVLTLLVYAAGMFVTLMENDSAQFAVMAMRMVQENDFINLFKGTKEYLDKPHVHYWLAALSYKIFGIHDWAYRIPGLLATILAAYSCFGLGKLLYNTNVGRLAALVFMTCQTIVLAVTDVRTDAVLTGFTIFAIWQLVAYVEKSSVFNIMLGAFGSGMAFSTKGQIALLVIGLCILCHIAYTRKWNQFLSWKVLVALAVFVCTISPMLYAYYHQFDLHPEKVIRGKNNRSGIFFIFWEQSFERLSGEGIGKNSSDYFFFFHTFLWVFLPWTAIALLGYAHKLKSIMGNRFAFRANQEFLTLGGISVIFFIISFAQFKLPHYMNIMMPLFAILTASYLHHLATSNKKKTIQVLLGVQYVVLAVVFIAVLILCFYVFKIKNWYGYLLLAALLAVVGHFCLKKEEYYQRVITLGVLTSVLLNGVLNSHFYPNLLKYQAGSELADQIAQQGISVDKVYKLTEDYSWSLDFYNKKPVKIMDIKALANAKDIWLYVNGEQLQELKDAGFQWQEELTADQFRITRLQLKFLNPATRKSKLNQRHLVHLQ